MSPRTTTTSKALGSVANILRRLQKLFSEFSVGATFEWNSKSADSSSPVGSTGPSSVRHGGLVPIVS